ncbi:hypothetical protein B0H10DRAFT_1837325, partial [Mycena sp. CBHHK59/15]
FLDEFVRHDGRGDYLHQHICTGTGNECKSTNLVFWCSDCLYPCLYCEGCVKSLHQCMPLQVRYSFFEIFRLNSSVMKKWDGISFKRCALKSLGIRIQLGHPLGERCPNPARAAGDDFVIINSHTIDEVGLDYCNCGTAKPRPIQLLRVRLYPATSTNPRSAATFAALRRFDHMALESKCSAYEFYNSLARETDNTGLEPSRVSTQAVLWELQC